jgi:hypothetical protein
MTPYRVKDLGILIEKSTRSQDVDANSGKSPVDEARTLESYSSLRPQVDIADTRAVSEPKRSTKCLCFTVEIAG